MQMDSEIKTMILCICIYIYIYINLNTKQNNKNTQANSVGHPFDRGTHNRPDTEVVAAVRDYCYLSTPLLPLVDQWSKADAKCQLLAGRFPGLKVMGQVCMHVCMHVCTYIHAYTG